MNGWVLVRIAGIVVGIATLLRVATNEKLVTYDPLFLAWMDRLRDIVELGFLTDLIGPLLHWSIEWVRSFGVSVPDLQDEWRSAWVLSMLSFTATARQSSEWWAWPLAVGGAFAIAIFVGLTGMFTAVAAVAAVLVAVAVAVTVADDGTQDRAATVAALVAFVLVFTVPATVAAAAVVTAAAAAGVFIGWYESSNWRTLIADTPFNIGLDILFAMGGAFTLAAWFANPPIW